MDPQRWLRYWLSTRVAIRPTTRLSHTHYIERFLIPHLGNIRLAKLTARQLTAFFATIAQETNRFGQPHTPATLGPHPHHAARRAQQRDPAGLDPRQPGPPGGATSRRRTHALVWTPGRVADWHATGIRPTVAVWTPAQMAAFLDSVRQDRLYALWWLAALHDLRHGAATLAHLVGTDLKTIQDQLGHSSIVLTADTYTSVLPAAQYKAAEATARLVLDAARHDRDKIAVVARRSRVPDKRQKVSPLTPTADQKSSQVTTHQPDT